MNIKTELEKTIPAVLPVQLNDLDLDPEKIKAIMINEVVPSDPSQDFYGSPDPDYLKTTIPLFQKAGLPAQNIQDILQTGIYITNAVKTPKSDYTIERSTIETSLPFLEKELSLFPNTKVIMLMGDVAKKAFNMLTKKATGKNAVPSTSTYKLRTTELYYETIRIIPSYIITGGNILIEKSKAQMASQDITTMLHLIQ